MLCEGFDYTVVNKTHQTGKFYRMTSLSKLSIKRHTVRTHCDRWTIVSVFKVCVSSHTPNTYSKSSDILLMKYHFRVNAVKWWVRVVRLSWIPFGYLLFRHSIALLTGILNSLFCLHYIQWISISYTGAKSKVKNIQPARAYQTIDSVEGGAE